MAEMHVRNIPDALHAALRERAKADGRSMSAQSIVLLEQALAGSSAALTRDDAIARLRTIQARSHIRDDEPPAEAMVRADREMRG
ncbi:MAG: hypothetical protein JST73_10475 [Actinobacteria bacterium]|nr:hypothetical protein [Actinomycetota bacterium]